MKVRFLSASSSRKRTLAAAVLLVGFFCAVAYSHSGFQSSELHFSDSSAHGLAIVPASCPSSPDYENQCSGSWGPFTTILTLANHCGLWANTYTTTSAQGVTLSWNDHGDFGFPVYKTAFSISPGIGTVPSTGSMNVYPTQTTTYTMTGSNVYGASECDATITVTNQVCPVGYVPQGNQCVLSACPSGYTLQGGTCVISSCPAGYTLQSGQCVNSCGAQFFCQGNDLYRHDASCSGVLVGHCINGCVAGSCLPVKAPSIVTWKVSPILVKSGIPVNVRWQASNVSSCSISGTNGDSWSCTGSACGTDTTKQSKPIIAQTIYTITCQALAGGSPSSVTQSTTVNIIPIFQEQ